MTIGLPELRRDLKLWRSLTAEKARIKDGQGRFWEEDSQAAEPR